MILEFFHPIKLIIMKLTFNPPNHVDIWDGHQRKARDREVNSLEDILSIDWLQINFQDPEFDQIVYRKLTFDYTPKIIYHLLLRYKTNNGDFQHDRIYSCDSDPSVFGIKNINEL